MKKIIVNLFFVIFSLKILFMLNITHASHQIISRPGLYALGSNITFSPTISNDSIIRISTSDVTLDLAGYILNQDDSTLSSQVTGIVIDPGLSNITIKNGLIANLTGTGITVQEGCSRITIENVITYSCDFAGMDCLGTTTNPIINLTIDNCVTYSCARNSTEFIGFGIHLAECQESEVKNSQINDNFNFVSNLTGLLLESCHNCKVTNLTAKNNQSPFNAIGIVLLNGDDIYLEKCLVMGTQITFTQTVTGVSAIFDSNMLIQETNTLAFGYVIIGDVQNITYDQCVAASINGGDAAVGFFVNDAENDLLYLNCQSLQITASVVSVGFFSVAGIRNNYINCIAKGNLVGNNDLSTQSFGLVLQDAQNSTIINCISEEHRGDSAIGIGLLGNCIECKIKSCMSYLNTGTIDTLSFGFFNSNNPDPGNNEFVANIAANNGSIASQQMFNFIIGTFNNISYSSLNAINSPFTNLGVVP